jgi:hypothetical protein
MEELRDSVYFQQLARVARLKAAGIEDPDLALRLREAAIKHERMARRLRVEEEARRGK